MGKNVEIKKTGSKDVLEFLKELERTEIGLSLVVAKKLALAIKQSFKMELMNRLVEASGDRKKIYMEALQNLNVRKTNSGYFVDLGGSDDMIAQIYSDEYGITNIKYVGRLRKLPDVATDNVIKKMQHEFEGMQNLKVGMVESA